MLTQHEAQLYLAEQLPEMLFINNNLVWFIRWPNDNSTGYHGARIALETEWQQIALWVEEKMTDGQWYRYWVRLETLCWQKGDKHRQEISANYQQRATAMKEAGIKL